MRIMYSNPYREVKTFLLRTDKPNLLNFEVSFHTHTSSAPPSIITSPRALSVSGCLSAVVLTTVYLLFCLRFVQEDSLEIPPGEGRHMYLRFQTQPPGTVEQVRHQLLRTDQPAVFARRKTYAVDVCKSDVVLCCLPIRSTSSSTTQMTSWWSASRYRGCGVSNCGDREYLICVSTNSETAMQ